jgi:hypothetical protein
MTDCAFGEFEEIDTIPKPDGLGNKGVAGYFLFDSCSHPVRRLFGLCSAIDKLRLRD